MAALGGLLRHCFALFGFPFVLLCFPSLCRALLWCAVPCFALLSFARKPLLLLWLCLLHLLFTLVFCIAFCSGVCFAFFVLALLLHCALLCSLPVPLPLLLLGPLLLLFAFGSLCLEERCNACVHNWPLPQTNYGHTRCNSAFFERPWPFRMPDFMLRWGP